MTLMTRWAHFAPDGSQIRGPTLRELLLEVPTSQTELVDELRRVRRLLEEDHLAALVDFPDDPARRPCLLPAQPAVTRRVRLDLQLPGFSFHRFVVEVDAHLGETPADLRDAVLERLLDARDARGTRANPDPAIRVSDGLRAAFPGRAWWAQLYPKPGYATCPQEAVVVLRCGGQEIP